MIKVLGALVQLWVTINTESAVRKSLQLSGCLFPNVLKTVPNL